MSTCLLNAGTVSPPGPGLSPPKAGAPLLQKEQGKAMNVDTKADPRHATGTAVQFGNEALMERLQAFGLIESNGEGGWQMTECCRAGLAGLEADTPASPKTGPVVIRPWQARRPKPRVGSHRPA